MTIELVLNFFPFGHPSFGRLVGEFRRRIFEEVAANGGDGLIFTYVWALDHRGDRAEVDSYCAIFEQYGGVAYFVELEADQEERLRRNATEFRLAQKPSKRDIERSAQHLVQADQEYQLNTQGTFFYPDRYIKINTANLSAEEVAQQIVAAFQW